MLSAVVLARALSPADFASYGYFLSTVAMLATYAALGLGVTASRLFAAVGHVDDRDTPPIGTLLSLALILTFVSLFLVLLIPSEWLNAGLSVPKWMIALGVAVAVANVVPGGGILGLEKYREATVASAFSATCVLTFTAIAGYCQNPMLGMWGIVAGMATQTVGQLAVIIRVAGWRNVTGSVRWSVADLRRLAGFAGPMFVVSILAGSGTWIVGRIILSDSGEQEFAAYTIGLQWFALGLLLPGIVSRVMLPRLVRSHDQDAKRLVHHGVALALGPSVMFALAGILLGPQLIKLYGNEYLSYVLLIPSYLLVAVLYAPIDTIGNAILAKDGQRTWLRIHFITFVTLLASLLAVAEKTALWASFAHALAALLMMTMAVLSGRKLGLV